MQETDLSIIKLLKENDETGLRKVFQLYFKSLHYFATQFVTDNEVAREIVHDAIFRFWQHRNNLKDNTHIKAYLLKIVRNLSLNYLSSIKREMVSLSLTSPKDELELNYNLLAHHDWDNLLVRELEERLTHIISHLPEKCRLVFELSRYKNLSNQQIADKLNLSVKTVEGHITDAIKTIRIKLADYLNILIILVEVFFSTFFLS